MDTESSTREARSFPAVVDRGGYVISTEDLAFLGLSETDVTAMSQGRHPLGMTDDVYEEFVETLRGALADEGAYDADVRIQGSSVRFFSGAHKSMLWGRDELNDEYLRANHGVRPLPGVRLARICESLAMKWPVDSHRPAARPFDVLHRIGVHMEPSDYDVQVSSTFLVEKIRRQVMRRGVTANDLRVKSAHYNFVNKEYAGELAYLSIWIATASELTQRPVTVAIFDSSGPPNVSEDEDGLSSHFRDDDWRVVMADELNGSRS